MIKKAVIGCVLIVLICPTFLVLSSGVRHLLVINSLHKHQEKWSELGMEDYRFILDIEEVFPHGEVHVLIEVREGQRARISNIDTQVEMNEVEIADNFLDRLDTIDELFEAIDNGVRGNFGIIPLAMWFSAEFDGQYHFPSLVNIDHIFLVDGGITYKIQNFFPLD